MKLLVLFSLFVFTNITFAADVPDGCPTDDVDLQAAVESGRKISCQITYFTGGRGGQWVDRPVTPNAKETIELACMDAQDEACPGLAMCYESAYYKCVAQ